MTLPRKQSSLPLGESCTQALQRYLSNERSLMRKGTFGVFQQVVQEFLDLGHAQLISPSDLNSSKENYYLPMHGVLKESSSSTKLCVVFDASAKTSNGLSLNDILCVGPTLHPNLDCILLRFHIHKIALTGDISKMYREVQLSEADRQLHRFVWRPTPTQDIQDLLDEPNNLRRLGLTTSGSQNTPADSSASRTIS